MNNNPKRRRTSDSSSIVDVEQQTASDPPAPEDQENGDNDQHSGRQSRSSMLSEASTDSEDDRIIIPNGSEIHQDNSRYHKAISVTLRDNKNFEMLLPPNISPLLILHHCKREAEWGDFQVSLPPRDDWSVRIFLYTTITATDVQYQAFSVYPNEFNENAIVRRMIVRAVMKNVMLSCPLCLFSDDPPKYNHTDLLEHLKLHQIGKVQDFNNDDTYLKPIIIDFHSRTLEATILRETLRTTTMLRANAYKGPEIILHRTKLIKKTYFADIN